MEENNYDPEQFIGYLLSSTRRHMVAHLNRNLLAEGSGITFEQWSVLMRLWKKDGLSQQGLANNCDRDKTTLARLLDNLEKQQIIKRVEDISDRRNKLIFLTESGHKLRDKLWPLAIKIQAEAREGISEDDLKIFKQVLEKIRENLS